MLRVVFSIRSVIKRLWHALPWVLSFACVFGVAIRLTLRDHLTITAAIYYATPPLVLAVLALFCGIGWAVVRKRTMAIVFLLTACACFFWWHRVSYVEGSGAASPSDVRIVFWNPARGVLGWPNVFDTIRRHDPDVIAIVEAGYDNDQTIQRWRQAFPDYETTDIQGQILLLCKGRISNVTFGELGWSSWYKTARIQLDDTVLNVVIVDIASTLYISRRRHIEKIASIADRFAAEPLVLMGDFNTPGDSVHFRPLRERLVNAFEEAGHGYSATWPVPVPVIQIDHVWANRRVTISQCELDWSWSSDHRPIVVGVDCGRGTRNAGHDPSSE